MKKNDEFVLDITDINEDGDGVGKYEGQVFFVKGAIPGDTILCGATALKKNYGFARIIEIQKASPDRVRPICFVAGKCGGCSLLHMSYEGQLRLKEKRVLDCFKRLGGFSEDKIQRALEPIVGASVIYGYRNKAQYPVGTDKNGNVVVGFYAKRSHRIVECLDCKIGHPLDKDILTAVKDWVARNRISVYDEITGKGYLRHIVIRHSSLDEIQVSLVVTGEKVPAEDDLIKSLAIIPVDSLCINVNKSRGNVILGNKTINIWGEPTILDRYKVEYGDIENSFEVKISTESFFQVNHEQMEKLYSIALDYAELTGEEIVWDLYCGIGTITMALAKHAKEVLGIEYVSRAINDAKENVKNNKIDNCKFYCGAAEDVLQNADSFGSLSNPDVVVLDPPRAGADSTVLSAILGASPKRIVYVSCNPATLARDCKILCESAKYEVQKITPVDQFCHGTHVETVVLMTRVK